MTTPIIDKISALLTKAERTTNEHEAEAFFEAAQRLATKYAIDQATIEEARRASGEDAMKLANKVFTMGKRRQFGLYTYVELFASIAYANDVQVAVTPDSTKVYAYGYDTDIAIVETLFNSLLIQMTQASASYIARGEYKNETVWRDGYWENYGGTRGREWVEAGYKPVHGSTARMSFQKAFAQRVGQRLWAARQYAMNQVRQESPGTGAELVLARKSDVVKAFASKFMGKGKYTGGQGATESRDAKRAGRAAGDKARIGTGEVNRGSKGQLS